VSRPEKLSTITLGQRKRRQANSYSHTVRYLGIEVDDALAIAEQVDV
jgi:hypothetical protein